MGGEGQEGREGNGSCESESYIPRSETQYCRVCLCVCMAVHVCLYAYW